MGTNGVGVPDWANANTEAVKRVEARRTLCGKVMRERLQGSQKKEQAKRNAAVRALVR
jgi:hypothetical protein